MPREDYPNLISPSPDEARTNGAKGGRASAAARRRRKTFAEGLRELLQMQETDPETLAKLQALGLEGTIQDALNMAQVRQAHKGDSEAFRLIRDTVGEKPRDEMEIGGLADRPIQHIDLAKLSDDQLRALAAMRSEED
jgi:hypothetical protein